MRVHLFPLAVTAHRQTWKKWHFSGGKKTIQQTFFPETKKSWIKLFSNLIFWRSMSICFLGECNSPLAPLYHYFLFNLLSWIWWGCVNLFSQFLLNIHILAPPCLHPVYHNLYGMPIIWRKCIVHRFQHTVIEWNIQAFCMNKNAVFIYFNTLGPEPAFSRLGLGGSSGGYSSHGYTSDASVRAFGAQLGVDRLCQNIFEKIYFKQGQWTII